MNTTNPILFFWKKEQKVFDLQLFILRKKLEKEAIHDLRVAVKKLRAYLELYMQLQTDTGLYSRWEEGLLTKTEELFDINGRQRDIEVSLQLLGTLKKETGFYFPYFNFYLKTLLKMARGWTNGAIHLYRKKELPKVAYLLRQETGLSDSVNVYRQIVIAIDKQMAGITEVMNKPHLLRKKFKLIYYWISLLPDNQKYQAELIHDIFDDLGSWQDYEVLAIRAKHFRKDYLPAPFKEQKDLRDFLSVLDKKKKELLKKARKKIKIYLQKVNN